MKPKNKAPESPANILAGWKLWTKNPKVLPSMIKASVNSSPVVLPWKKQITIIVRKKIEEIPPARPSNPSIKLIIFIQAIIKMIVIGYAK